MVFVWVRLNLNKVQLLYWSQIISLCLAQKLVRIFSAIVGFYLKFTNVDVTSVFLLAALGVLDPLYLG